MLVVLSDHDKSSLAFLASLPPPIYPDLVKTALANLLTTKQNTKAITSAATKLKVEVESLTASLDTISKCFVNSARKNMTESDLVASLSSAGVKEALVAAMTTCYSDNKDILVDTIRRSTVQIPEYESMEWRLECQVGSRSLNNTVIPNVLTKWNISDPSSEDTIVSHHLNCDVNTLQHIAESLRAAQQELDSFHARKMTRNLARIG